MRWAHPNVTDWDLYFPRCYNEACYLELVVAEILPVHVARKIANDQLASPEAMSRTRRLATLRTSAFVCPCLSISALSLHAGVGKQDTLAAASEASPKVATRFSRIGNAIGFLESFERYVRTLADTSFSSLACRLASVKYFSMLFASLPFVS